ncbi:MAG: PAS domain-containing protein, partial [Planctomycetaceae bacterium]|nr:PAS domain-containing protein [Planctomycetaceae bacterium]
ELRIRTASQEYRWFRSRAQVQLDETGRPIRLAGSLQDIHEIQTARERLTEAQGTLKMALHAANLAPWDWNIVTNKVVFFPEWCMQLGYEIGEIAGTYEEWEKRLHPDDKARTLQSVQDYLHGKTSRYECDFRLQHKDGSWRFIRSFAVAVWDANRKPLRMMGCHADITDFIHSETERTRLESRVQQAQKLESLAVMAGGAAHDFNNFLTIIQGNASFGRTLISEADPCHRVLLEIEGAAEQAADLTQQMLTFAGKGRFDVQPLRLDMLIKSLHPIVRPLLAQNAVLEVDLSPVTVAGDKGQIRQIVMNLLTNASAALEAQAGVIRVATKTVEVTADRLEVSLPEDLAPGKYACLEVADTGCGIPEDVVAKIFEPFFTTRDAGRGVGLAAVLGIVLKHRGGIQVHT